MPCRLGRASSGAASNHETLGWRRRDQLVSAESKAFRTIISVIEIREITAAAASVFHSYSRMTSVISPLVAAKYDRSRSAVKSLTIAALLHSGGESAGPPSA